MPSVHQITRTLPTCFSEVTIRDTQASIMYLLIIRYSAMHIAHMEDSKHGTNVWVEWRLGEASAEGMI